MKQALLILCLLATLCTQGLFAEGASDRLDAKLDEKIAFKSDGKDIESQLREFSKITDIDFKIDDSVTASLHMETKKFFYQNTRAKYVFYRLMKDAGLKYSFDGDIIKIFKSE